MATSLVNRPLTDKQKEFVKIYVESDGQLSKTECARLAGYDEKSAYQRAYELTNPRIYPNVCQEIGKYKSEYMEKYKVTPENHIQMLAKIRDKAFSEKMYGVAGRMEELRGKATGLYVEKTMTLNKTIEDLSEEELAAQMKQILDENSLILEGGQNEEQSDKEIKKEEFKERPEMG